MIGHISLSTVHIGFLAALLIGIWNSIDLCQSNVMELIGR